MNAAAVRNAYPAQTMRHTELRAIQKQDHDDAKEKPQWDSLHWVKAREQQEEKAEMRRRVNDYYINMGQKEMSEGRRKMAHLLRKKPSLKKKPGGHSLVGTLWWLWALGWAMMKAWFRT